MHQTFRYRLYPNRVQAAALVKTLDRCRELYNAALQNHRLALSISDVGWGQFVQCCVDKAASVGRYVLFVNPRFTSQTCSGCGVIRKKALSDRRHSCACGTELDRDHNATINIARRGCSQRTHGCGEATTF